MAERVGLRRVRSLSAALALSAFAAVGLGAVGGSVAAAQDSPPSGPAPLKVAIIDTQKILHDTEEGIRIEANIHKLFDPRQAELMKIEKALGAEYDDIMKDEKAKGKADALEKRKADLRLKVGQYQQAYSDFQRDLNRKQQELYGSMVARINVLVDSYAKRESIDVVIEKQAAVFFRRDLDITERIIQLYNAGDANASKEAPKKDASKDAPKEGKDAPKKDAPPKQ
ncbi:MAG: OmpH family outer membrane protein [Polyangiaceae bacterium]